LTLWMWLSVGIGAFLVLSAALGLSFAAVLARISREVSELLESEPELLESELLASAPLAREQAALASEDETPVEHLAGQVTHPASR
jgi:hypothetical protein